jgi:hypothetical protein
LEKEEHPQLRSIDSDRGSHDRSAGVPPAVSGASRPRFGEIKIRDRGRFPRWEKEPATYFITLRDEAEFDGANQYIVQNPIKAGLKDWPWVWFRGHDVLARADWTPALPSPL